MTVLRFSVVFVVAVTVLATAALAADAARVMQKNRAFALPLLQVSIGEKVAFENADAFPHQIHVSGPHMDLDSDLQSPGETMEVLFTRTGTFNVTCGIHPKMSMVIDVK